MPRRSTSGKASGSGGCPSCSARAVANLEPEIQRCGSEAEQTHHAGGSSRLADVVCEERLTVGERRQHLAAVGWAALGHDVDELEDLERPDYREDHHQYQRWPYPRQ